MFCSLPEWWNGTKRQLRRENTGTINPRNESKRESIAWNNVLLLSCTCIGRTVEIFQWMKTVTLERHGRIIRKNSTTNTTSTKVTKQMTLTRWKFMSEDVIAASGGGTNIFSAHRFHVQHCLLLLMNFDSFVCFFFSFSIFVLIFPCSTIVVTFCIRYPFSVYFDL